MLNSYIYIYIYVCIHILRFFKSVCFSVDLNFSVFLMLTVTTLQGSITYSFPCEHWLARSEEDGAIERELLPDKITKEVVGSHGNVKRQNMQIQDKPISKHHTLLLPMY